MTTHESFQNVENIQSNTPFAKLNPTRTHSIKGGLSFLSNAPNAANELARTEPSKNQTLIHRKMVKYEEESIDDDCFFFQESHVDDYFDILPYDLHLLGETLTNFCTGNRGARSARSIVSPGQIYKDRHIMDELEQCESEIPEWLPLSEYEDEDYDDYANVIQF